LRLIDREIVNLDRFGQMLVQCHQQPRDQRLHRGQDTNPAEFGDHVRDVGWNYRQQPPASMVVGLENDEVAVALGILSRQAL
jgi:hypothetical protein